MNGNGFRLIFHLFSIYFPSKCGTTNCKWGQRKNTAGKGLRMIRIAANQLTGGMIAAQEVRSIDDQLIVAKGVPLSAALIEALVRRRIAFIYVEPFESNVLPAQQAESTDEASDPAASEASAAKLDALLMAEAKHNCAAVLTESLSKFQEQSEAGSVLFAARQIEVANSALMREALKTRETISAALGLHDWGGRLFQHSVSATAIAAILAEDMGIAGDQQEQLALGMLFHDCGQMLLPRAIVDKPGKLSDSEYRIIRQHTRLGSDQLVSAGVLPAAAADVVLHHHEKMDGSGYPDHLQGDTISPLARIAAVAEAFDAMTSMTSYGRAMPPHQAMRQLLANSGTTFDLKVILALLRYVAIYPTGSAVRLDTGECGLVVSTPPDNATRPTVRLYFDATGKRIRPIDLVLSEHKDRLIVATGQTLEEVKARVSHPPIAA